MPNPTPEQLLRLLRHQGYTKDKIIRGMRALTKMDANPGMTYEQALEYIEQLDQGKVPVKAGGQ